MSALTLRYRFDDSDDFGWLDVEVITEKFSGRGGFWVQWQDVADFGERLSSYPIEPDAPVSVGWGYDLQEGEDLILGIEIEAANPRGDLRVRVQVADDDDRSERVRTSFLTNYPDLERFRTAIAALMGRKAKEAVLAGR